MGRTEKVAACFRLITSPHNSSSYFRARTSECPAPCYRSTRRGCRRSRCVDSTGATIHLTPADAFTLAQGAPAVRPVGGDQGHGRRIAGPPPTHAGGNDARGGGH